MLNLWQRCKPFGLYKQIRKETILLYFNILFYNFNKCVHIYIYIYTDIVTAGINNWAMREALASLMIH